MSRRKVRVLLGDLNFRSRSWVMDLIAVHSEIETVGPIVDPVELLLAAAQAHPDVVIVSMLDNGDEPGVCSHLVAEYPSLTVLIVSFRQIRVWRSIISKRAVNRSNEALLRLIRSAGN